MLQFVTPKHADIWAGAGIIGFVSANIAVIDQWLQGGAFLMTIALGVISIVARIRKNKQEKDDGSE